MVQHILVMALWLGAFTLPSSSQLVSSDNLDAYKQLLPSAHMEPEKLYCPAPYRRVGTTCLYFHTFGTGTWHDFQSFCKGMGGNLAKVDDANLLYDIVKFITEEHLSAKFFWLGGTDEGHEGTWKWTDNTQMKMGTPFWGTVGINRPIAQEPSGGTTENCLAIERDVHYLFHDYSCNLDDFHGICEYGPSP